jgi:adenine/guanine phosphoribosyltransferase-like PRPP-binding protein
MTTSHGYAPPAGRQAVQRQFDYERIWELSQPVFEQAAAMLAEAVPPADVVVGIARGGVPLAELVAGRLGVPTVPLRAQHNLRDDIYLPASGDVRIAADEAAALAPAVAGRRVLVADDICGTGATLAAVLDQMPALHPVQVGSAALCRSEAAAFTPDVWIWDTRDWVVFPWNDPAGQPTEMLRLPQQARCRP